MKPLARTANRPGSQRADEGTVARNSNAHTHAEALRAGTARGPLFALAPQSLLWNVESMSNTTSADSLRQLEIPGRVKIVQDKHGLWKVVATTGGWTKAEVYLNGAHVTDFQKKGEPPLLFLSATSQFAPGKAIRGGVPIIFPWFGNREGKPAHGFARTTVWELMKTAAEPDGGVKLHFKLPQAAFDARVEYIVTVTQKLTMEMIVTNTSSQPLTFENCLHAYFLVGDINDVTVNGLKGVEYLDKADGFKRKRDTDDVTKVTAEIDRLYMNTTGPVEVRDDKLRRTIRVEKSGSASTVVWNPWVEKSKAFTDFGDEDYQRMICVESGNIGENQITLQPGETSNLKVTVATA
jgi:D-hexose-6-phosphate mutarotase